MVEGSITSGAFLLKLPFQEPMSKKTQNAQRSNFPPHSTILFLFKHTGFIENGSTTESNLITLLASGTKQDTCSGFRAAANPVRRVCIPKSIRRSNIEGNKVEVYMCPFCYEGNKVGACAFTIICQALNVIVATKRNWLSRTSGL